MRIRKPFWIALGVFVIWYVITVIGQMIVGGQDGGTQESIAHQFSKSIFSGLAFLWIVIAILRWWHQVGYKSIENRRDLRLLWFPILYLAVMGIGVPLFYEDSFLANGSLLLLGINFLIVAFSEETMIRGVMFHGSRDSFGPIRAVWITAILFGLIHLGNGFVTGNWSSALQQTLGNVLIGIFYGALRLRLDSLFPGIIFHWLWNFLSSLGGGVLLLFPFTLLNLPPIVGVLALQLILAGYGFWLLRDYRQEHPNIAMQ